MGDKAEAPLAIDILKVKLELLTEHYQKTYELNHEMWRERNSIFLTLLGVIGAGALLSLRVTDTTTLMIGFLYNFLHIDPAKLPMDQFEKNFPFGILQSILLLVILYLMINLYHRTLDIKRNYSYLDALEKEIRLALGLESNSKSIIFTREGSYYATQQGILPKIVTKIVYVIAMGGLLVIFVGRHIVDDWQADQALALFETLIAVFIGIFFLGYASL